MIKKALLLCGCILISGSVLAQWTDELQQPEPQDLEVIDDASDTPSMDEQVILQPEQEQDAITEEALSEQEQAEQEKKAQEEDEDDKKNNRKLRMYLSDVSGILTSARSMSSCFANVNLHNGLKYPLQTFQATITYGQIPVKFSVSNLAPNARKAQQITLVGRACESLLSEPKIQINRCAISDMSEGRCKSRFLFEPPVN